MNAKRLEGALLNFWVARAAGLKRLERAPAWDEKHDPESGNWHPDTFLPAHNWSHAVPILAGEWYAIEDILAEWFHPDWNEVPAFREDPLKWFMRAYVALQYGEMLEDGHGVPNAVTPGRTGA